MGKSKKNKKEKKEKKERKRKRSISSNEKKINSKNKNRTKEDFKDQITDNYGIESENTNEIDQKNIIIDKD